MSMVFKYIITAATALASLAFAPTIALGQSVELANPLLITFSKWAQTHEGDHDHRQVVRFSVPAETQGLIYVHVFDADTGGAFDEALGRYNTIMDYTLYGADGLALLSRDETGQVIEQVSGAAISRAEIGRDRDFDGQWASLFQVEATAGKLVEDQREFFMLVEGMKGDDGNVFDVRISHDANTHVMPKDLRLYTFLPTVRMPEDGMVTELTFTPPAGSAHVLIENFDSAKGEAIFASRYRSLELDASGQDEWAHSTVSLEARERGQLVSVTLGGGHETPNDASFFVADAENYPVAINLPPKSFAENLRPILALAQAPRSCSTVEFDGRQSFDPDGGTMPLTYRWTFEDGEVRHGAVITQEFAAPGKYAALLEIFDGSGQVGNGARQAFEVFVKAPPVAAFTAPDLVAQGASLTLDAAGSSGAPIARYRWVMGNGHTFTATQATSKYSFATHGDFDIELQVSEQSDHPCNTAVVRKRIAVNAPPHAEAGGDRDLIVGKVSTFDAGSSNDPDGSIVSFVWDFGDGETATGKSVQHTYHRAGDYAVRLRVGDDTGFDLNQDADKIIAHVRPPENQRPVALAGGDRRVVAGQAVLFDATNSSDADGQIIETMWDFGDGTGGNRLSIEHTYWQVGTYELSLTLRDNSGQKNDTAVDSAKITVVEGENLAPIIDTKDKISATVYTQVLFDASGSDDRDGSILRYSWDFGDGSTGHGAMTHHAYKLAGTYQAKLTLEDNRLPVAGVSVRDILVTIFDDINVAPVAHAGQNFDAVAGVKIRFDGSASSDQNGSITTYQWDFGDGHNGFGVAPDHIYQFAGDYQVNLSVTDNDLSEALVSQATISVHVTLPDNQSPMALAGADLNVQAGDIINFDGTASSDPDGNITAYLWDFGNGQSSTAARPLFAYPETGTYQVKLRVFDDHLVAPKIAQDTLQVEVRARTQAGDDQ